MDPILETQMQQDQRSADDRRRSFARRQESLMERVSKIYIFYFISLMYFYTYFVRHYKTISRMQ